MGEVCVCVCVCLCVCVCVCVCVRVRVCYAVCDICKRRKLCYSNVFNQCVCAPVGGTIGCPVYRVCVSSVSLNMFTKRFAWVSVCVCVWTQDKKKKRLECARLCVCVC